jgi:uncharacterized membrane protein YdjX (TVP38/TMEM64 family)
MQRLLRATLWLALFLAVPIVPFLFLGEEFEAWVTRWFATDPAQAQVSDGMRMLFVVGVLASDILLPIPSSAVSTWAGGALGIWLATLASWTGMTLGATFGFALARLFGSRFARRRAGERDINQMAGLARRYGPLALVLTRALPILAEACVLLMGASGLSWKRFFLPVAASNLMIALCYSAFGRFSQQYDLLPLAAVLSGTVPLCIALLARRWLPAAEEVQDVDTDNGPERPARG